MLGVLLVVVAGAWDLVDPAPYVFVDLPIEQQLPAEDFPGLVPPGQTLPTITAGQDAWNAVECAGALAFTQGPVMPSYRTFDLGDGLNTITLDDPDDDLDVGVLAATLVQRFGIAFQLNGVTLQAADNADICFNDNVVFGTAAQAGDPSCQFASDAQGTLMHELGHALGLGHSDDPDATMNGLGEVCDDRWSSLSDDDRLGAQTLYGHGFSVGCSALAGPAPLSVDCVIESAFGIQPQGPTWTFGDGASGTGAAVSHVFSKPGAYAIEACATSAGCATEPWCGTVDLSVCGALEPRPEVVGTPDPLVVQLRNETALDGLGCLDDAAWTVRDTTDAVVAHSGAWEPAVLLPAPGTYTAELWLSGLMGEATERVQFDTRDLVRGSKEGRSGGCSTAPTPMGWFAWLPLVLLLTRRGGADPSRTRTTRVPPRPRRC